MIGTIFGFLTNFGVGQIITRFAKAFTPKKMNKLEKFTTFLGVTAISTVITSLFQKEIEKEINEYKDIFKEVRSE